MATRSSFMAIPRLAAPIRALTIAVVDGELDSDAAMATLLCDHPGPYQHAVVDFAGVDLAKAEVMGRVLALRQRLMRDGCKSFELLNTSPQVSEVAAMLGLHRLFRRAA